MERKIENVPDVRDQLIAGLRREIELQDKIIKEQQNTIDVLEEQLEKFQQLIREILDSQEQ